ncbi:uncharacterized protein LOC112565025 [Pomacea canaliculata]|uniref:uncharacterized protein LOC112565025 n=1 Tax=Pomacea canaliculata TaxID=400727 RepID=UPI000D73DAFC|nr:uncharacterized protein LOC112565025 [Pomacea canaliculata]
MVHLTVLGLLAVLAMVTMSPTIAAPSFQSREELLAELKRVLTDYEDPRGLMLTNNQDVSSEMMEKRLEANEDSVDSSEDSDPPSKRDFSFKFNNCRFGCPKRSRADKGRSLEQ